MSYQFYLGQYDFANYEVDYFTDLVARQTQSFLTFLNYSIVLYDSTHDPSVVVQIEGTPLVRIVEGCNALSVMILFASFIMAFSKGFVKTAGFIAAGLLIIHVLNVSRIGLLTIGIMNFPEYKHLLHGVVFPLIIYGIVFLLWILWITKFVKNDSKNNPA